MLIYELVQQLAWGKAEILCLEGKLFWPGLREDVDVSQRSDPSSYLLVPSCLRPGARYITSLNIISLIFKVEITLSDKNTIYLLVCCWDQKQCMWYLHFTKAHIIAFVSNVIIIIIISHFVSVASLRYAINALINYFHFPHGQYKKYPHFQRVVFSCVFFSFFFAFFLKKKAMLH